LPSARSAGFADAFSPVSICARFPVLRCPEEYYNEAPEEGRGRLGSPPTALDEPDGAPLWGCPPSGSSESRNRVSLSRSAAEALPDRSASLFATPRYALLSGSLPFQPGARRHSTAVRLGLTPERLSLTTERLGLTVVDLDLAKVRFALTVERFNLALERLGLTAVNLDLTAVRFELTVERFNLAVEKLSLTAERFNLTMKRLSLTAANLSSPG
jgi:hypothetical protein